MKFELAVDKYLSTRQFNSLSRSSQRNYESCMRSFCLERVVGRKVGNMQVDKMNAIACTEMYDMWEADTSTSNANHRSRVFSVLMNYLVALEHIPNNPMARVKKRTSVPRSVVWTNDQVEKFLDVAFTKFDWRNIGLIVLMAYEWGNVQWTYVISNGVMFILIIRW